MVSLGIISTLFTTWFGIALQAAAAAATAAGHASQQHVQPQASDEKTILYIVGGILGNTTLVASSIIQALQMDASPPLPPPPPFLGSSYRIVVMGSSSSVVHWQQKQQQPVDDEFSIRSTDYHHITTPSLYNYNDVDNGDDNNSNNNTTVLLLYMVHGSDLWQLESPANKWTLLAEQVRGFAGPSTVVARSGRWLVSCFAKEQDGCVCFDTRARVTKPCITTSKQKQQKQPTPRGHSRSTLISGHYAVVHGGKTPTNKFLGDLWLLDISNAPHLIWHELDTRSQEAASSSFLRVSHAASLINATAVMLGAERTADGVRATDDGTYHRLVRRAEGDNTITRATRPMTTTTETKKHQPTATTVPTAESSSSSTTPTATPAANSGLNGGAIAGIIVGICGFLFMAAGFLVWKRRQQRRKLHYFQKQHHRSARFSLSTTPPSSRPTSTITEHLGRPSLLPITRTASLPEPNTATRASAVSFESGFRISAIQQEERLPPANRLSNLHHDFSTSYSSVCMPGSRYDSRIAPKSVMEASQNQDEVIQRPKPLWLRQSTPITTPSPIGGRRGSSGGTPASALKRITLNISSALRRPQSSVAYTHHDDNTVEGPANPSTQTSILKRYTISGMVFDRRRSSGMLLGGDGGRAAGGPSRFISNYYNDEFKPPRMSMSSLRSVSSVQWVEFNDQMDYKEQHWDPTVQLAVTNQLSRHSVSSSRATSVAIESSISSGTPRQSTANPSYRLSTQEVYSWEDMFYQQQRPTRSSLLLTRQQPSAISLPPRPPSRYRTHDPTSAVTSHENVVMDQSKISV